MKPECINGAFNLKDEVYFSVIVNDKLYAVQYKIIEKIESITGFSYFIDIEPGQNNEEISMLISQQKIGTHFRVCGDSLFKTEEEAKIKARDYFQNIVDQLS